VNTIEPSTDIEAGVWVLAQDPETDEQDPRQDTAVWEHQDTWSTSNPASPTSPAQKATLSR